MFSIKYKTYLGIGLETFMFTTYLSLICWHMVTSLDTRQYSLLSMIRCWFQEENKIDLREMNQMRTIYF